MVALQTQIDVAQKTAGNLQAIAETQENAYLAAVQGLRDVAQQVVTNTAVGTFSLARTQIAMWIVLTLGRIPVYLADDRAVQSSANARNTGAAWHTGCLDLHFDPADEGSRGEDTRRTDGFFKDIIYDKDGPSLYPTASAGLDIGIGRDLHLGRFLGFQLCRIRYNLLLLTGIFNSMYLGLQISGATALILASIGESETFTSNAGQLALPDREWTFCTSKSSRCPPSVWRSDLYDCPDGDCLAA